MRKKEKEKQFQDCVSMREKIQFLLELSSEFRDHDTKLVAAYYLNEIGKDAIVEMSAFDFLSKMSNKELPSYESICVIRRGIQVKNENLRGQFYRAKKAPIKFEFKVNPRKD